MAAAVAAISLGVAPARAETLLQALASAYSNNPTLNAARAGLRSTDENVPQALAGYRPTVFGTGTAATQQTNGASSHSTSLGLEVDQPLFKGFQTKNKVSAAEAGVRAARESLRGTEQTTLLSAVTDFMDLVKAQANLNLQKQNVDFLNQQLGAANDRLRVGEGTKTDVSQTQAKLAAGQSQYDLAVSQLNAAIATYEQVIGHRPKSLGTARPITSLLPQSLDAALAAGLASNPGILAASYQIDAASFGVNVAEGALLPTLSATGTYQHSEAGTSTGVGAGSSNTAKLMATLRVPIYTPGVDSGVRQAKEDLGQARIQHDVQVALTRQQVITAWGSLDAARAQARAADAQVQAQTLVLSGIQEQQKVGQSTTLDVLNAQQDLLSAKLAVVSAQHDRVVASYALLAAIGKLSAENLGLQVARYDPTDHYRKVRDKWFGLRTPDGR